MIKHEGFHIVLIHISIEKKMNAQKRMTIDLQQIGRNREFKALP